MTISRRNHGSGHSYTLDGVKVPGVTTILQMVPKTALIDWAGRATAEYALDHWADLTAMPPSKRLAVLNKARYAERDKAARRGTAVHRLAEQLGQGLEVEVPEELTGHVESYLAFLDRLHVGVVAAELVVASREHSYCGTLDLIADLPAVTAGDERYKPGRWLLDIKTSRSGVFRESALQLAAYRHADIWRPPGEPDAERPMPWLEIDHTGVVHVRADGWDLRPVDTSWPVWEYFRHLAWLYHHDEDTRGWIGDAADPPPALPEAAAS
jgi:hypothetical protein